MNKKSANLYLQTEYSLLNSNISLNSLKKYLSYCDYEALAITDNGMHGVFKFYNLCKEFDVKPIIGLRCNIFNENYENVILLYAKNNEGYKALMKISSMMSINPKNLNLDYIQKFSKDLIVLMPVIESEIEYSFKNNLFDNINVIVSKYRSIFEDFFIGISMQTNLSKSICEYLKKDFYSLFVPINKTNYYSDNDIEAYQVLRMIDKNTSDYNLSELETNLSFLSKVEMDLLFNEYEYSFKNIDYIIKSCNVILNFDKYHFPKYKHDSISNIDSKEYLIQLCKAGLNKRLSLKHDFTKNTILDYKNRLLYELEIIDKMGFNDYFLIVYDYVKYAKTHDISVGPGRGSAGGSLVSYSLGITEVDPLEYDLLFERFLNPERKGMPDIDVDFEDQRRDEIIMYLGKKYGKSKIAHITTFGTFKAKLAIRDVSRMLKLSDNKLKELIKYISSVNSIEFSLNNSSQLKKMYEGDEEIARVINLAMSIEGLPKNYSTHAAGIIMADTDLCDYTALQEGINGVYQTQYEASDLEALGLVKMDILGLRNLSIIKNVINLVKVKQGIDIDLRKIPLNDSRVFQNISKGNTLGIFQLEGEGVTKVLKSLKTSSLNDIINATSLYRPGPMEMIPSFINRKFKKESFSYLDKSMEDVLKDTYGVIVFQEQIILIASGFAGYSLGEADVLRRAVSKKKAKLIEEERNKFVAKAVGNSKDKVLANKVYDYIEKFASYGFNKSHAVSYSIIAYQMAYLKTYYYQAFMASLMTNFIGSVSSISTYINDLRKNKFNILPPSINKSFDAFVYDEDGIYYSLLGINNLGNVIVSEILKEREKGLFKSYEDFVYRCKSFLNKRVISSLVYSGALDEFVSSYLTKKYMVENYENVIDKLTYLNVLDMDLKEQEKNVSEYTFEEISIFEKEALGFNLKYNLFIKYNSYKEKYNCISLADLNEQNLVYSIVCIRRIREINTKKGDKMAFAEIFDETLNMDAVIFSSDYLRLASVLENNKFYLIKGKTEKREEKLQFVISDLRKLK